MAVGGVVPVVVVWKDSVKGKSNKAWVNEREGSCSIVLELWELNEGAVCSDGDPGSDQSGSALFRLHLELTVQF